MGLDFSKTTKEVAADPDQEDRKVPDLGETNYCSRKSSVVLTTQCFGISISFMFMAIDIDTTAGGKRFDESQAAI